MAYGTVKYTEPGAGTAIYFDDDGASNKTQAVKLIDSTAGSTTPVGTATNPLCYNLVKVSGVLIAVNNGPMTDGTFRVTLATDSAGQVALTTSTAQIGSVKNSGVFAVQASQAIAANFQAQIAGDVAHGTANTGNPVYNGMEAIAHGTNPTQVAAAARTKTYANRHGIPFFIGGHPNIVSTRLNFNAAQTDTAIITVASGLKIVLTGFQVTLDNASTTFPAVRIGFGTGQTPLTTGVVGAHGGLPAGGGFGRGDGAGIIGIGADGDDLRVTTTGVAGGSGIEIVTSHFSVES